jgi:hypothetical protein
MQVKAEFPDLLNALVCEATIVDASKKGYENLEPSAKPLLSKVL